MPQKGRAAIAGGSPVGPWAVTRPGFAGSLPCTRRR
jgi:hypothetical protein